MEGTVCESSEIVEETQQLSEEQTEIIYGSWDKLEDTFSLPIGMCLQFLYLFPRDYEFQKNDIIQLWISQEYKPAAYSWISQEYDQHSKPAAYSEMVDTCTYYFEEFERMNIFILLRLDHSTHLPKYKLNKSMFYLLQQLHDDAYSIVEGAKSDVSENTLHSSIYDTSIDAMTLQTLYHAKRLCTLLILHESGSTVHQVPREIFLKLPLIRVLDLSNTNIKEVPSSIGKLKQLRYLNLSGTAIVGLPESLCSLYELRILKLKGCLKLVSLPNGMRRLIKLQYLDVDVARLLVSMPPGFGDLTDLYNLPAFVVGKESRCSITELKQMVNLHGTLRILRLENVSNLKEASDAALDSKKHIVKLQLQWTEFQDGIQFEVLQNLQPHTQIEKLQIVGFASFEFPSWIGDPQFSKLVEITLHDCRKCTVLPRLGKLPFLKHLFISDMHAVKSIDSRFCGRDMVGGLLDFRRLVIRTTHFFKYDNIFLAFPSLENFTLNRMPALEKWTGIEKGDFHHLQKLSITCCSKLTSLPDLSLIVSMQQLEISLCPSLKSLPNNGLPVSLQCLIIMDCPLLKEWCLEKAKLQRGLLADIPNIWIDYRQISRNTEVNDSGRNLTVQETRTKENKQVEGQLVNHGKNKKQLNMKEMIFEKKSKGGKFLSHSNLASQTETEGEILQSFNLKRFSFTELRIATRNFHSDCVLHEDGVSIEFKGWIGEQPGTGIWVAVKRLRQEDFQDDSIWLAEVNYWGRLYHCNLVRLVGHCLEDEHRFLVYEYMPLGRLENHLFRRSTTLSWSLRMKVALGVASGLAYLHWGVGKRVIYRYLQTSDILLDMDYHAKLSCFDLRVYEPTDDNSHVTTRIMGKSGYASPEYISTGHLTVKSDVYGFGVVLLEMLSGQRVIDSNRPSGQHNLVEWALNNEGKVLDVLDSRLEGQYSVRGAGKAVELVLQCLSEDPSSRPNMYEIVKALEGLQVSQC